ncbi:MAG: CBS domain-containing protein [Candidatus Eisenbacteria bacterium]
MTTDPVCVPSSTPLIEAYRIFREYEIRHLPVVDGGQVVGMITDHDLGRAVLEAVGTEGSPRRTVFDAMSHPVQSIGPDDVIEHAAMLMHNLKLGGLPVVDENGHLLGILTIQDLLEVLIAELAKQHS